MATSDVTGGVKKGVINSNNTSFWEGASAKAKATYAPNQNYTPTEYTSNTTFNSPLMAT